MKSRFSAPVLSGVAALIVGMTFSIPGQAQQKELRVVNWGGAQMDAHKVAFYDPFAKKSGIKIVPDSWSGQLAQVRAMVQTKNYTRDIYVADTWDAVAGCDEGFLERIDPKKDLGLTDADLADFYEGAILPCGVSTDIWTYIWSWDRKRHPEWTDKTGPKNIADIFDVKKFPGKRGFGRRAYQNMEYALQADGVALKDIYKVLETKEGVRRSLAKLEVIKPVNVWWTSTPQQVQYLADGVTDLQNIVGARWYNAVALEKKDFAPMWAGQVYGYNIWIIPKGTPNRKEAMDMLKFVLQPEPQARQAEIAAYAPARKAGLKLVKAEVQPLMPTAHFDEGALSMSATFWAEHMESYTKEFEVWLQK